MAVDYIPLMLVNASAGLTPLAGYVAFGVTLPREQQRDFAPPFAVVGLLATIAGLHMALTWPMGEATKIYMSMFGELTVLFGVLFLGAALALGKGWSLTGVALYAVVAALAALVLAAAVWHFGLTAMPPLTAAGFALSGLGGGLVLPVLRLRHHRPLRIAVALILLGAALVWLATALPAYWMHIDLWTRPA